MSTYPLPASPSGDRPSAPRTASGRRTGSGLHGEKFLVPPALDDAPVLDHEDHVRVADRGEPVGDDEGRPTAHEGVERLLHDVLRFGVERGGRLVEDEQGASFRSARAIASRWRSPPDNRSPCSPTTVAYPSGIRSTNAARWRGAPPRRPSPSGRRHPVGDVVPDRVVEEHRVLADDPDLLAKGSERDAADVDPSIRMRPPAGRRTAGSGRPAWSFRPRWSRRLRPSSRGDAEVDLLQTVSPRGVPEIDAIEGDLLGSAPACPRPPLRAPPAACRSPRRRGLRRRVPAGRRC